MEPSPSSSSDEDSHHHVRPELRLLTAVNNGKLDQVIAIIEATKAKNSPTDHLLRIGLVRAAERGQAFIAEYLLKNGAKPDGAPFGRSSPLLKAVETNQVQIVRLLLNHGGNVDIADKQGRTVLMIAACKNHWHALNELLRRGADVNKKDNKGRNVLHNLAADDDCSWGRDIIHLLLQQNIAIDGPEGQDDSRRSPLHWAVSTGKKELCEMLIMRPTAPRANINAREKKDKTPLHLAVAHGREDIVGLLIHYGADITAKSDGGWTVLHSACQQGSVKILGMLLEAGAEINAQLLNGQTPLHEAVHSGHLEIVKELLLHEECKRAVKDAFGITPFVRAAQKKHKEIIHLLAPFNHVETLSKDALAACTGFNATIIDFGNFPGGKSVQKKAVYEILYGRDVIDPRKPAYNILPRHRKAADFRWIHIPTNNINWIEDLLAKVFIEEGADDVEGYMDLQQSLSYQHGGKLAHSRFMTPACRITTRAQKSADDELSEDAATEQGPPQIFINSRTNVQLKTVPATKPARRNPPKQVSKSNIFFCMPYLHYETDSRRCEMQGAIKRAELSKNGIPSTRAITYDEMLIRAYLVTQNSSLHVRRTLDQSFYHNIDTQTRDWDQVIYRYQLKHNKADSVDPKIFMVDQLWMWTLGKDLIVTSFPQRWQQAKNDPMNVLDNIIETITSRRREPVRTVYDLAMTITECCLGVYDRLCIGDNAFQFLDMFESTLGDATDREDLLFKEFNVASLQASAWLQQRHQRPDRMLGHGTKEAASANIFERFQLVDPSSDPLFVDKLLDISQETMLLAETKDIRDELNMIAIIFRTQQQVLPELEMVIADIYGEQHRSQQSVKKPIREQLRNTEMRMKEIERMDKQAERVYMSVIDLLDLKQKQDANAFEGRMARNQAESTARQSQIIMVFTIVTIIFLPLNFIAAVFAINIREFPRDPNQDGALPLAYVSKYTFGIGFAVSVPMIAIALSLDGMTKSFSEMKRVWREIWPRKRTKNGVRDQEDGRGPTDLDWTLLAEKRTLSISHAYGHHDRASRE